MIAEPLATDRALTPALRRRRLAVAAATGLALLAGAGFWWAWAAAARSVPIDALRLAAVTRGTLVRDAQVNGRTVAATSPTLVAPAAGTVALLIRAGDTVRDGQVLATLASPEMAAERAREHATWLGLQADLGRQRILAEKQRALAERDAAEAQLAQQSAARDDERTRDACAQGVIPLVECLRVRDTLQASRIRAAHAARAATLAGQDASFELQSLEQRVARQAAVVKELDRRLGTLSVRAPVDGLVGSVAVADRAAVAANTPLMTVVDLSRLEVELQVPERLADELGPGMRVELRIGSVQAAGILVSIAPEVQGSQVLARVRFDGAQPEGLRQNQRLGARVLIEEKPGVLTLPRGPFVEALGGHHAYVVEAGRAVRRPVRLGAMSVSAVEVEDGLAAGDRVVIGGTEHLGNAAAMRLRD